MSKVLLAYDGSDGAQKALDAAAELGGEVTVVTVTPRLQSGRGGAIDPVGESAAQEALGEAQAALAAKGIDARTIAAVAHPADGICAAAEDGGFDLIAIGSRGLHGVDRFLVGSTATRVVAHAPCSVLVVR